MEGMSKSELSGASALQGKDLSDPHDPEVLENKPEDQKYETVDDVLEGQSATEQLASMLEPGFDPQALSSDEKIDLAAESEDASIDWTIVSITGLLVAAVVVWGLSFPDSFSQVSQKALDFVVTDFGWAFVLFSTVFVVFVIAVAASKFGTIKLGAIDEEPEFATGSWIAMMFAAGMGIGLMF